MIINPILHGLFYQRMLHERGEVKCPYLIFKPKVMEILNLACALVFIKLFKKSGFKLMTSRPYFENYVNFAMTLHVVPTSYLGLFFDTHETSKSSY